MLGLSLVAGSRGFSLVAVHGLPVEVASPVEHRLHTGSREWASGTWDCLPLSIWNLQGPGTELVSSALAGGFLTTGPWGGLEMKRNYAIWKTEKDFLKQSLMNLNYIKMFNSYVMGIPEGKRWESRAEKIFWRKNGWNLKDVILQILEAQKALR